MLATRFPNATRVLNASTRRMLAPCVRKLSVPPARSVPRQFSDAELADHSWRQTNHLWTEGEIDDRIATADIKHVPQTRADAVVQGLVRTLYHSFNFVTGYKADNPTVSSIQYRLIILESFAGVPGFIGAAFRHFRSLRMLERDHGFIFSLLEEAENERMHLLCCMKQFEAGPVTRSVVVLSQGVATPALMLLYVIRPQLLHRFVGYLEETAVHTYTDIVKHATTPGSHLHTAWAELPAPDIAIQYWQMDGSATWVDTLKRMLADESHHRDVNHAFASLDFDGYYSKDNPFIHEHIADYDDRVNARTRAALKQAMKNLDESSTVSSTPLAARGTSGVKDDAPCASA